ncbi:MAG: hypothetical protein FWG87_01585 [Defluviitaleaceae bacterium]|nr:hypothetical protein [Defluviitaleaceae bacterium]
MREIEDFNSIIDCLILAKKLYDIGRYDVIGQLWDELCLDSYYENMLGIISSVFTGYKGTYSENEELDIMMFSDDVISDYFVHAWQYGEIHNIHYSQNPYVLNAHAAAQKCLYSSCCVSGKLMSYIRTKKSAQKSKVIVLIHVGCGSCNIYENVAYGLIELYTWFKNQCAEIEAMKATAYKPKESESSEVTAA